MTSSAFVFPGQGSQSVGMGKALAAASPAAAAVFADADATLGLSISQLAWDGPAIEAAAEIARDLGARKAIVLPVSVAAHSPLMIEAAEGMRRVIAEVEFRDPSIPLLANVDARPITTANGARTELVEHLTAGVD